LSQDQTTYDLAHDRFLLRLGINYFLNQAALLAEPFGGDVLLAVTFLTINTGNLRHLDNAATFNPRAVQGVIPDELRRPVTIAAVSRALGIPRETARRYVNRLIEMGYCRATGARGVVIPTEVLMSDRISDVARKHGAFARELMGALNDAHAAAVAQPA